MLLPITSSKARTWEDFCAGVMDRFREDRRYRHGVIELSLNFRDPACAA